MKTKLIFVAVSAALACSAANATGNGNVQQQIDDLKAGLHQVHMNTLTKYSESWGLEDRANIGKLQEQKLDKSVFTADQQRQDKALSDAVASQAETDAKQTSDLKSYADKKATSAYQTAVAHTDAKVARADADRAKGDAALQAQITSNLSAQTERDAGQDEHINAVQDAAQSANEKADNLAVRADGIERQAGVLDGRVGAVEVRADTLEEGQRQQDRQMESDRKQRVDGDRMLSGRIDKADAVNIQQDKAISGNTQRITTSEGDIKQLYANGEYAQSRIDAANANIEANRNALVTSNKRIAANTRQLADHEQRLGNLEQQTNSRFAEMKGEIKHVEKRANAGTATALAAAGIPQVTGEQRFSLGAALGGYESEQAVAVGFSSRVTSNVVIKASVATDSQHGVGYNVGTSIGW